MKPRTYLLFLFLFGIALHAKAQQLSLQWAQKFGHEGWDYVNCLIADSAGNYILGGSLNGVLSNDATHAELSYSNNSFLAACDTNGNILWQKTFGGKAFDNITSLARIPQGILISGIFQDTICFDSLIVATTAYTGAYLALVDEMGNPVWLKKTGGEATVTQMLLCSNPKGQVFMAGTFVDSLQLAGEQQASPGEKGFFLATIQSDGRLVSPVVLKSKGTFSLGGICSIDSLVCMAGSFSDTLFVKDTMLVSVGAEDVFIALYTTTGILKHLITAGGRGIDQVRSVAFSPTGDICIAGCFNQAFLAGNQVLKSNGGKDIFIAVVQQSGRLKWLRSIGGPGDDYGYSLSVNKNNDIFVSGNFVHNIQMPDENGNTVRMDASSPFGTAFIAKYNASGDLKASYNLPANSEDYCKSIIAGDNGMIMAAGNFYQSMQLQHPGGLATEIVSEGDRDIFLLRFMDLCRDIALDAGTDTSFCAGESLYLTIPESYPYFRWLPEGLPNRDLEVRQPGTYRLLITDDHGCIASDSIKIKMNLLPLVSAGNDTTLAAGEILRLDQALAESATDVKWTAQGSGYFDAPGLLHTSYSPSYADISKGTIQLRLSATNQCGSSDRGLLLKIKQDGDGITVFPNPTLGIVTLVCTEGISIRSAAITGQAGNMIEANVPVNSVVMQYNLSFFPPGTFLFHINTGTKTITKVINRL